jgi:ubiquinone/menaquinone biosynthesis C-methylase UbiE
MKLGTIAKRNLQKDKKVLGKNWKNTYHGFFGNKKHMQNFVNIVLPFIPKKNLLSILYVASASGSLGELLAKTLNKKGYKTKLTITDMSKKHLLENKNKTTKKICGDLLKLNLTEQYDIIIMRSSLDYFPTKKLQIKVLKKIKGWLSNKGIFINQACLLETKTDRDTADKVYSSNNKIGKRHFHCPQEINFLYKKANLSLKKIGEGVVLLLNEKDHIERYEINEKEIKKAQKIIKSKKTKTIFATKNGYTIKFVFPIYLSKKN